MPIFELACHACRTTRDVFLSKWDDADPVCERCGGQQERLMSNFSVVFSGPITARYCDKNKEGAHADGFWAYRKLSSVSGQPEPVYINDWQQLRDFNRAEGLAAPGEAPTHATISADGKRLVSDGLPGQWRGSLPGVPSAVYRMDRSMTSLSGRAPAPVASGPPCTVQAVDACLMEKFSAEVGKG